MKKHVWLVAVCLLLCASLQAQQSPAGKTWVTRLPGGMCVKTRDGGGLYYDYNMLFFTADSVEVWTCMAGERGPSGMFKGGKIQRYAWTLNKGYVHIPGFSQKGLFLNRTQLNGQSLLYPGIDLCWNEQPQPAGKIYITGNGVTCKDGVGTLHFYRSFFFGSDSVRIHDFTEAFCTDRSKEAGYEKISAVQTCAWTIDSNTVHIFYGKTPLRFSVTGLQMLQQSTDEYHRNHYLVRTGNNTIGRYGSAYVSNDGDTVIPAGSQYYCLTDTIVHYGLVHDRLGNWSAIDARGQRLYGVCSLETNAPDTLSEGLFRMYTGDALPPHGRIGYANALGEVVIGPQYSFAGPFVNGRARVSMDMVQRNSGGVVYFEGSNWFYIDRYGRRIN